jgi:ATP-dependent Lon protease
VAVVHVNIRPPKLTDRTDAVSRLMRQDQHDPETPIDFGGDTEQRDVFVARQRDPLRVLHDEFDKEDVRECLEYALEVRRRIKEQLKRIGGMEFFDVHFSYIDLETNEEKFVVVQEQGGGKLIPESPLSPGALHTVTKGSGGHLGLYRLETQETPGSGKLKLSGLGSSTAAKEGVQVGFDYFRANATQIQASAKPGDKDFHLHIVESHNTGPSTTLTLAAYVALCSALVGKAVEAQLVVLGTMSLGGNIVPVENLAESLQVAADAGAKRLLLPMASVGDIPTIPGELFAKFQTSFYADPQDAVFKALGVQ